MISFGTNPLITLLTDFGTKDHYVSVMKGVIAGICPGARVIDISHEVAPFQIAHGAYLLEQAWRWFPAGSIHVAVVDPGVGTMRRALAAEAAGHRFLLPDNGLLSGLSLSNPTVREIQNSQFTLPSVSRTFHGRDIFAPAAAHLAAGLDAGDIGPLAGDWIRLDHPPPSVIHIDRFGNIVTNIIARAAVRSVLLNDRLVSHRYEAYGDAPRGELFLIEGSGGYLEISEREGDAARRIGCRVGDPVTLRST